MERDLEFAYAKVARLTNLVEHYEFAMSDGDYDAYMVYQKVLEELREAEENLRALESR